MAPEYKVDVTEDQSESTERWRACVIVTGCDPSGGLLLPRLLISLRIFPNSAALASKIEEVPTAKRFTRT
jgi:hypothetical protein